jgi:glycosyltransferase involved in cell wall biosynthesis
MRILFNVIGDRTKASARVRGYWIGEELEARGHEVAYHQIHGTADVLRLAARIPAFDVIVFQKSYSRYHPGLGLWARKLGKRVFFDIDDAPSRENRSASQRNARRTMQAADVVLAGSSALVGLAREAGARRVHLVPSGIRLANYAVKSDVAGRRPVCVGWIGNGAHYAEDLLALLPGPLTEVAREVPLRLRIVGSVGERRLHEVLGALPGVDTDLIDTIDWASPEAVADAVAPFDVGLYPLRAGPFNDFKCGFKALEYMALGIPVVASDVANHAELIDQNVSGFLVHDAGEWSDALRRLVCDPALRREMGRAGRRIVEERFDTKRIAAQIESLFAGEAVESWHPVDC